MNQARDTATDAAARRPDRPPLVGAARCAVRRLRRTTRLIGTALAGLTCLAVSASAGPAVVTDLEAGLKQAVTEKKLLFVFYGNAACSNCPAVKGWIAGGLVRIFPSDYVVVELDGDDPQARQQFEQRFQVAQAPLPWLVVATADGTQLAARGGDVDPGELNRLLRDALRVAAERSPVPVEENAAADAAAPEPALTRGPRTWRADSGRTVTATFVEDHDGQIVLDQEDGSRLVVPLRRLVQEDRDYIAKLKEAKGGADGLLPAE
ncbi:hypothetical protein HQ590_10520 [bacterium]|nr:hypothetical protein [bacterium]